MHSYTLAAAGTLAAALLSSFTQPVLASGHLQQMPGLAHARRHLIPIAGAPPARMYRRLVTPLARREVEEVQEEEEGEEQPSKPVDDLEAPNAEQGINTPDNVAQGTWTEDAGCATYYAAIEGDTCNAILEAHAGLHSTSLDLFLTLNPSVNDECTNLAVGSAYCVGIATPANAAADTRTVEKGCIKYQSVKAGDYCIALVAENADVGLTLDDLYASNPSINSECTNLWIGTSYCVGLDVALVVDPETALECPPRLAKKL